MRFRLPGNSEGQLRKIASSGRACLALFAAADALTVGFVKGVSPHVYVERIQPANIAAWKSLRPCEPGEFPEVVLRQAPAPQSVFRGMVRVDGAAAADVLQIWLDVAAHPSRGAEQADLIRQTGLPGTVLPWRDVLHEGPLPNGLTLEEMSEVRAHFLAQPGAAGSFEQTLEEFRARDATLAAGLGEEIVLWFEADLYDQLQILQILDWLGHRSNRGISLICIGDYPGIARFFGLGQLTAEELAGLFSARFAVTPSQLQLAGHAWRALTAPDPGLLNRLTREDCSALEFLGPALLRFLAEYPLTNNGLGETERQVLRALEAGPASFDRLFPLVQAMEERPFMGDTSLWLRILALSLGPEPAITIGSPDLQITPVGRECLRGNADFIAVNGVDRWIGGVHLTNDSTWRWDPRARQVGKCPTRKG